MPGSEHAHAVLHRPPLPLECVVAARAERADGEPAFPSLYGMSAWEYRAKHPEESAIFDRWMTANTETINDIVAGTYDFSLVHARR